jgi:hypothetical protein
VFLHILKEPLTQDSRHVEELLDQLSWYLSFFWAAFSKASAIDVSYAEHASSTLGWIGLAFYEAEYLKITEVSADNIISVTSHCFRKVEDLSTYQVADILMPIWYIRMLAEVKHDEATIHVLDSKLVKLQEIAGEQSTEILKALQTRQRQLQEDLSAYDSERRVMFDKSKSLLKQVIEKYQKSEDKRSSASQDEN